MKDNSLSNDARFHSADIEAQHRELDQAMGKLRHIADHGSEAEAAEALEEFVDFLASYFLFHTFTEEKLMYDNDYPRDAYFRHVREHKEVILDLIELQDGTSPSHRLKVTSTNPNERSRQLIAAFHGWIEKHIQRADSKLVEFLESKGV